MKKEESIILFVGTYPPRECGIATFTRDLTDAIDKKFSPFLKTKILAINNNGVNIYNYPKKVIHQISDTNLDDYIIKAKIINNDDSIKLISIQHEFGIFGGPEMGEYLIPFLKEIKKPKIITFHSVIPNPSNHRKFVVREIAENVNDIIVMTPKGVQILKEEYKITKPIHVIPHGIPSVSFESQLNAKKQLNLPLNSIILSSFGMMGSGKGYEYVIESLPEIIKEHPRLLYLIVGATHPNIRKHEGEQYRNFLDKKVKALKLEPHVKFYNKYVTIKEIIQYLKATDLYISSTLTPEQITSGTLAYAMGVGRAVVSTPFLHAQDLINQDRGALVEKFRNSKSFSKSISSILANKEKIKEMEHNNYAFTRQMTWPNVALSYGNIIKQHTQVPEICFEQLPRLNTKHIKRLTDKFGIIQFTRYSAPDIESGYTLDDNARALLVASMLYTRTRNSSYLQLIRTYVNYIKYVQHEDGRFYNIVSKNKIINKEKWSEEAHGRAMRSLGFLTSLQSIPKELKEEAESLLIKALPTTSDLNSPRAIASVITGLYYYNKENYSKTIIDNIKKFADKIVEYYTKNSSSDWRWFEPYLTYANSKLPEALLYSYMATNNSKYLETALSSLNFLISHTFESDIFIPIGQNGWFEKGKERAFFDQQPIDAASMVVTLSLAYKLTRNPEYEKRAISAFQWFLGKNTLKQVIYNENTGGCHDGLGNACVNLNQGAESTLSYFLARLTLAELL